MTTQKILPRSKANSYIVLRECSHCGHSWESAPAFILKHVRCPECGIIADKNNEDYVLELKEKFPNVINIEKYVDAKTEILHQCLKCGHKWNVKPCNILVSKSVGCPKCSRLIGGKKKRITKEEFLQRLLKLRPNIKMIGEYISYSEEVEFTCLVCGNIWESRPKDILSNSHITRGCYLCRGTRISKTKTKSKESYLIELQNKNPSIELIGDYIDRSIKTCHRCKVCSHIWMVKPSNILSGKGCPKCGIEKTRNSKIKTHELFINEIKDCINPNVKILGKYTRCDQKIDCECLKCGEPFKILPAKIKQGMWHFDCMIEEIRQSKMLSLDELKRRIVLDIEIVSTYNGYYNDVKCLCNKCGKTFMSSPGLLVMGYGCTYCSDKSYGEMLIQDYLDSNNIEYVSHKNFKDLRGLGNKPLSYDFFLPKQRLLIEFNGQQHYKAVPFFGGEKKFEEQIEHDKRKQQYADSHDYYLLSIKYDEVNYIFDLLENVIKSISVETTGIAQ